MYHCYNTHTGYRIMYHCYNTHTGYRIMYHCYNTHTGYRCDIVMAEVPQDEIKVDITLGHVGRHCILHALTVIEAVISQVC